MDFKESTAIMLARYKGKDTPENSDFKEAERLISKWNRERQSKGLDKWI